MITGKPGKNSFKWKISKIPFKISLNFRKILIIDQTQFLFRNSIF